MGLNPGVAVNSVVGSLSSSGGDVVLQAASSTVLPGADKASAAAEVLSASRKLSPKQQSELMAKVHAEQSAAPSPAEQQVSSFPGQPIKPVEQQRR